MPRIVRHHQTGPYRIEPQNFPRDGKPISICACGLTRNPPYCDGSHKPCRDEDPAVTYVYDESGRRPVQE